MESPSVGATAPVEHASRVKSSRVVYYDLVESSLVVHYDSDEPCGAPESSLTAQVVHRSTVNRGARKGQAGAKTVPMCLAGNSGSMEISSAVATSPVEHGSLVEWSLVEPYDSDEPCEARKLVRPGDASVESAPTAQVVLQSTVNRGFSEVREIGCEEGHEGRKNEGHEDVCEESHSGNESGEDDEEEKWHQNWLQEQGMKICRFSHGSREACAERMPAEREDSRTIVLVRLDNMEDAWEESNPVQREDSRAMVLINEILQRPIPTKLQSMENAAMEHAAIQRSSMDASLKDALFSHARPPQSRCKAPDEMQGTVGSLENWHEMEEGALIVI